MWNFRRLLVSSVWGYEALPVLRQFRLPWLLPAVFRSHKHYLHSGTLDIKGEELLFLTYRYI